MYKNVPLIFSELICIPSTFNLLEDDEKITRVMPHLNLLLHWKLNVIREMFVWAH